MNINRIIFTKTAPKKKVEIVENLTPTELLSITAETITRMVKEAGSRLYKSRDKELRLSFERRTGNNWDSTIEGVRNYKGKPVLDIYFQYENTDTNTSISLDDFLKRGNYQGSVVRDDRYGNPRSYYFTFTPTDKARFVRRLLLEYLNRKYKDKL